MKIELNNNLNTFTIISNKNNKFELNLYIENNNLNISLVKEIVLKKNIIQHYL